MGSKNRKIHVIGINSFELNDLSISLKKLIADTNNIAAPRNYIDQIKNWFNQSPKAGRKFFSSKSNEELINWLKKTNSDIILFSRGDPLWFGIGRVLLENFSKEELSFYPSNTCIQQAFSKLKIPWQQINCISIHGRDSSELIKVLKSRKGNLAIITDSKNKGLELIRANLIEMDLKDSYDYWICEELGFKNEKIRKIEINENLPKDISDLNIVILIKNERIPSKDKYPLFGINDNLFKTFDDRPNLITKRDVRIQILADLELPENGFIWDVGAGSGTIGLEAIKLRPKLKLFSFDKRFGTKKIILENAKRLGVSPMQIIEDDINKIFSEDFMKKFKPPNRLIIGGCDKKTKIFVINQLSKFMNSGNIIVITLANYEVLRDIEDVLKEVNFETNIKFIQTYKGLSISEGARFEPNNPVFLIKGKKI